MDVQDESGGGIPRRQPDGDPPVPPVEIPDPGATADGVVAPEDLRELLEAPGDAALVVEDGEARVVDEAAAADAIPVLKQQDLATMLEGPGADDSDETLEKIAGSLDEAVRSQDA